MRLFFATLGFLTRLPVPAAKELLPVEEFKKGIIFYPIVGLITGTLTAFAFYLFYAKDTGLTAAILAIGVSIAVTGGFHQDGLADSFDGLFSSRNKEQMLVIMRDSRIGAFGVLGLFFVILIKISVLYSLPYSRAILVALLMPVLGKTITPLLMHSSYARSENGLGSIYLSEKYTLPMIAAMLIGTAMISLGLGYIAIIPLAVAGAVAVFFRRYCQRVLGGMTGDTLGCGSELCEAVFLLTILYTRRFLL